MNKTAKTVLIVALSLFGLGLLVFFGASLVTGYSFSSFANGSAGMTVIPEGEVNTVEKIFDAENRDIEIDVSFADVSVGSSPDEKIHFSYTQTSKVSFELKTHSDKITLSQQQSPFSFFFLHPGSAHAQLLLPAKYNGDLEIDTASGSIWLKDISISGDFEFSTASGSIKAENCACLETDISTASGDVALSDFKLSRLDVSTASGGIKLGGIKGKPALELETASGSIDISDAQLSALEVSTHSGDVSLDDLKALSCSVENTSGRCYMDGFDVDNLRVSTISGDISGTLSGSEADYSITARTVSGRNSLLNLGGHGKRILELRSTSGDIEVSFAG